jgi:alpha-methylacyl-CoA racemase
VLELAAIGPVPLAGMILADMGCDVVRIDRLDADPSARRPVVDRGRRSIGLDLKCPAGRAVALQLVEHADVLLEGFRPGVAERLGIGPDACAARNPRLVYGRITGWGQEGPYSQTAGHDINYIAIAGALAHLGRRAERPAPPLALVGDFGGGALFLVIGVLAALVERERSGRGQVIDAAIVDGVATLMALFWSLRAEHRFNEQRGSNLIDSGAPFYDVYETADGELISVGPLEPKFCAQLFAALGIDAQFPDPYDEGRWPQMRAILTSVFKQRSRAEWVACLGRTDACFAPVLTMSEAARDPHLQDRGTIVDVDGIEQPAPAPRFGRTPSALGRAAPTIGEHTAEVLSELGYSPRDVSRLRDAGAIR